MGLGFENADRLSVLKKKIVGIAGSEREFTNGNAGGGAEIEIIIILNLPACQMEEFVNILPGFFFRFHWYTKILRGKG